MLNKILRTIVGVWVVTCFYVGVFIMNLIVFCLFSLHSWVTEGHINGLIKIWKDLTPVSPYQFVKDVWKD